MAENETKDQRNLITKAIELSKKQKNKLQRLFYRMDNYSRMEIPKATKEIIIESIQIEIERIIHSKMEGALIRSRQRLYEPREKPTNNFFAWEKKFQTTKSTAILEGCNTPEESLDVAGKFYK